MPKRIKARDGVESGFMSRTGVLFLFFFGMPMLPFLHHSCFQGVGRGGWEGRKEEEERREESGVPPGGHCPHVAIRHLKYD